MTSTLYKAALLSLVCIACGDDDSSPPDSPGYPDAMVDGSMDASDGDASEPHGDGDGGGDSSVPRDGSTDSSIDADGGDAAAVHCELVEEPLLSNYETPFNAVRVPLEVFCSGGGCSSLSEFAEEFDCTELEGDASIEDLELAEDAGGGCCFNWWVRTEGCGSVQYRSYMTWPRVHTFDADTGEKIGYARQDDIDYDFGGCTHYGFVAGELLHDCPTATESICNR